MKKQINDGFKMWGNYVEAIDNFTKGDDKEFGRFMRILCAYGIYGEEIAQTEIEKFFFTSVKSSIDASIKNIKNGKLGGAPKSADFIKPTEEEVKAYCEERKNKIKAKDFIDYYDRNGWIVGKKKDPMKDWKAAVRYWERTDNTEKQSIHNKDMGDIL